MRLVTLIENTGGAHRGLYTEHGLSFYLETDHIRLIFDFGESGRVTENIRKLGMSMDGVECAVCSHAHYDHAAGFPAVTEALSLKTLVTGPDFWLRKYASDGKKYAYLGTGFGPELLKEKGILHKVCSGVLPLSEDCWAISGFSRIHAEETIPARFVLETEPGVFQPDPFNDEVCLAVETGKGLAVIVGCSHPGILNMIETVGQRLNRPVVSVWGGAHLMEATSARIRYTAKKMEEMGIQRIGLCHCSGNQQEEFAACIPGVECSRLSTGDMVFL